MQVYQAYLKLEGAPLLKKIRKMYRKHLRQHVNDGTPLIKPISFQTREAKRLLALEPVEKQEEVLKFRDEYTNKGYDDLPMKQKIL